MSKARILIATPLYPPEIGGPATYTRLLERELPKHGFKVSVVAFSGVRHLPSGIRHCAYFWRVLKKAWKCDAVYAQDPISVGVPAMFAARFSAKPFLLKVVGDWAWEQAYQRHNITDSLETFVKKKRYPLSVRRMKWVERAVAKRARCIITPSEYLKNIVGEWGVPRKRIQVVYNSIGEVDVGQKEVLRKLLGFSGTLLVSAGRLVPWKGFDTLIDTVPYLAKQFSDFRLLIIGEGPEYTRLNERAKKLGVEEHVAFTGNLDHDVLLRYIGAADAFVLNSKYEGFSHLLLEAMAVGAPVVATDVGGNSELIEDKQNGFLVPQGDKKALQGELRKVLSDAGLQQRLGKQGRNTAASFTPDRTVRETASVLKECIH